MFTSVDYSEDSCLWQMNIAVRRKTLGRQGLDSKSPSDNIQEKVTDY